MLLPNGWSLKPAGRQTRLGDFPVQMAVHPSEPVLAILHAGYGEHEVVTANTETGKIIGRVALPETFAGLAWSADGKQLYVGGGFDDRIYRFDHARGLLSNKTTFPPPDSPIEASRFPAVWPCRPMARRCGSPTSTATRLPGSTRPRARSAT